MGRLPLPPMGPSKWLRGGWVCPLAESSPPAWSWGSSDAHGAGFSATGGLSCPSASILMKTLTLGAPGCMYVCLLYHLAP